MKKLNRITACFLAMSFSLTSAAVYAADAEEIPVWDSYIEETANELTAVQSDVWETAQSRGSVTVSDDDKDVVLNTSASSRYNAYAEASTTLALLPSNNDASLKFNMQTDEFNSAKQTGTVSIKNAAGTRSVEVLSISNTTLTVLGDSEAALTLQNGTPVAVELLFNTESGSALVQIGDNTYTITDNVALKALHSDSAEGNTLKIFFKNASDRIATDANLTITGFEMSQSEKFGYTGITAGGEMIGAYCKQGMLTDGIKVGFGGNGAAEIYEITNYSLTVNGSAAEFAVSETDGGLFITPVVPFAVGDTVKLTVLSIKDKYGVAYAENSITEFTVLDDNYVSPTVELSCADTDLYVGQTALIDTVLGGSSWDYAQVYVNDVYKDTVEREQFTYSFTPETEGTYTLRFDVLDNTYSMSDSEEITVTFTANAVPQITLAGYSEGDLISIFEGSEGVLGLSVSDDLGIEKTEIYVNGSLAETTSEASYSFALSTLPLGTSSVSVKAYDIYGRTAEVSVSVLKSKEVASALLSEKDFIEEGVYYTSGIQVARQRGYIRTEVVDAEHGKSMLIGKDENISSEMENFPNNQYTYIQHNRDNNHPMQKYEFDLNVVNSPEKDVRCLNFALRYTDGVIPVLFAVQQSTFFIGSGTMPYNEGEWYHISIIITKEYYSITVTDEDGNTTTSTNTALDTSKTIERYRFYVGDTGSTENLFDIAIDNITVSAVARSIAITGIGSTDQMYTEEVPTGIESFCLYTEGAVIAEDVNKENVSLLRGTEQVEIEKMRYSADGGFIEIYPKEPLAAASEYTVELSENIRFLGEQTLGETITYSFRTKGEGITVNGTEWEIVRNNLKLTVKASNLGWVDKKIYVFMSEFDDNGKFAKTTVFKKTLFGGGASYDVECILTDAASSNVEMFISDGTNIGSIYHAEVYEQ